VAGMARAPLVTIAVVETIRAGDPLLVIDVAFLPDAVAEVAIDNGFTGRIVVTTLGAGEIPLRLVDATFEPYVLTDLIATAVQAACLADRAFAVAATGPFDVRNAIDTATSPTVVATFRVTRDLFRCADCRRRRGRFGRCALIDRGFCRRIFRRRCLSRWLFSRWWVYGLLNRRRLLDDRLFRWLGLDDGWFFILRKRLAGAA
jgi:hypothetical protein